jgi:hypothetical protein
MQEFTLVGKNYQIIVIFIVIIQLIVCQVRKGDEGLKKISK